jgi:hypothetical protein
MVRGETGTTGARLPWRCLARLWTVFLVSLCVAACDPVYILRVRKDGAGSGNVYEDDGCGQSCIDCGEHCWTDFTGAATLRLVAEPDSGSQFTRWAGCDSVDGLECTVRMRAKNRVVIATFELETP